jgi:biotin transporter BioY
MYSQFFSSKCRLFDDATFFGSCIIHNLHKGVLKFKCTLRFSLQNAVHLIMLPFLVPVLFTIYILGVLKFICTLSFSHQNAIHLIMLPFLVPVLFTFYIQGVC